jgi:hypothetical protein
VDDHLLLPILRAGNLVYPVDIVRVRISFDALFLLVVPFTKLTMHLLIYFSTFSLYESRKGTPTQTEKRRFLKPLCYVELFPANLLRCVTFAFGCIAKFSVQQLCTCQTTTEAIVNVSDVVVAATSCQSYAVLTNLLDGVLLSQAIEICVAGGILTILFLKTARPGERATRIMSALLGKKRGSGENKGWTFVCRFCCTCTSIFTCCLFGGARAAFADLIEVSTALEVYFDSGGYLDVTLSDIISGLILVYREQKLEREACRRQLREWQGLRRTASDEENQSSGLERLGMNRFVMKRRDVSGRRRFVAKSRLILDSEHDHDREAIFDGGRSIEFFDVIVCVSHANRFLLSLLIMQSALYASGARSIWPPNVHARSSINRLD